jgi:phosphotriesterase-related protein
MAIVRTVTGDIDAGALGCTALHEHVLAHPPASVTDRDLALTDEAAMTRELRYFYTAGGRALVEMSTRDWGRQPGGLARVAAASGVHIVAATGWIRQADYTTWAHDRSAHDLADEMIGEVLEGMREADGTPTRIRAGVLKAGSSKNRITDDERRAFEAVCIAHRETGAAVSTHTEAGTMGLEQVALLRVGGVPAEKILIGHCDRNLDWAYHLALAQTGVTLGYDQIAKEKYFPDAQRIAFIARLVAHGFGGQIALSGDLARASYFPEHRRWGGPGYTYLLWRFVPWLMESGIAPEQIETMLVDTPRRLLALERA